MFSIEVATTILVWAMAIAASCGCMIFVFKMIEYALDMAFSVSYMIKRWRKGE